jgi:anti-sigma B factor antagonist
MPQSTAILDVRRVTATASVIEIQGEMTTSSEAVLMDAYTQACGATTKAIILKFDRLEYMNSGGVGLLVTLLIRVNRHNRRLLACGPRGHEPDQTRRRDPDL